METLICVNERKEMDMKKMKKKFRKMKSHLTSKIVPVMFTAFMLSSRLNGIVIQAADKNTGDTGIAQVNSGINVLKTLVKGVVSGVGFIILMLGVVDFGTGISEHNSTQQHEGIKKIVAGIIVCAAPWIVTAMGIA